MANRAPVNSEPPTRFLDWLNGALAGVGFLMLAVLVFTGASKETLEYGAIGIVMLGVAVFSYKTEVKRQLDQTERKRVNSLLKDVF